ncbi:MAG TPA: sensor histidine kinase [Candidatus Dormibacteraeota bacterium]|nr:sensor histidine kinase [Candidatus Dormibacteraeota bacterium]
MKSRLPLAYQILALQVCIVILTAGVGLGLAVWQARQQLYVQYQQRSLAVAESVASMPEIKSALLQGDPAGSVQSTAEEVRRSTGASYVVVADRNGIRFSHPNRALIGKPVDESPGVVLAGHTWVGVQRGTLGDSARGKAPIFSGGQVIGMVSVGYRETTVSAQLLSDLGNFLITVLIALGLGVAGSMLLARHVKRQTFGLEPYEIAGLLEEREASLQGIREGALAVDGDDRITLANAEARRLLGLNADCVGKKLSQVLPDGRLRDFLAGSLRDEDEVLLAGDRVLLASRRPVRVRGRDVGHVMTLRDSRELPGLSAGFGVDSLTDALRAQAHEFSNRLHTIAGLVELGRGEEAIRLIAETSGMHQELSETLMERMGDPVLGALLLAKAAIASERGIELRVSDDTVLTESPLQPDDLITLLGNLIDNAIDAAAQSPGERWVSVAVGAQDEELVIRVEDSGPGVPVADRERVFVEGFTTKARTGSRRRGMGLALAREVARRNGGEVTVTGEHGAVFTARLPLRVAAAR